jgi:predicted amidohydrolase
MKVAVIQNKVYENIFDTLKNITELLKSYDLSDSDFLVLPEMFITPYEFKYIKKYAQDKNSLILEFLKDLAIRNKAYVIGGSIPYVEKDLLYNTTFTINRKGEIINRYDKMHLFEVTYPNGVHYTEKAIFSEGEELGLVETEFGKIGIMICFDIRFPELADGLMKAGAKVIFVPAAFNTYTGPLHWQTTFRARAIDNQLFLIGCSPSADSFGEYNVYGHSIITDPYGEILAELANEPGVIVKELDLDKINEVRKRIPIIKNKKLQVKL